ncbi:MAG: hypothetical protein ACJ76F_03830 [Bacteroidia bacterium]
MKVFYLHFNEEELIERAEKLTDRGYTVRTHSDAEQAARWDDYIPDIVVISLDRLPSHGRAYADWIWESKKRQNIPIIFSGGKPDKVAPIRAKFPGAIYCTTEKLTYTVEKTKEMLLQK